MNETRGRWKTILSNVTLRPCATSVALNSAAWMKSIKRWDKIDQICVTNAHIACCRWRHQMLSIFSWQQTCQSIAVAAAARNADELSDFLNLKINRRIDESMALWCHLMGFDFVGYLCFVSVTSTLIMLDIYWKTLQIVETALRNFSRLWSWINYFCFEYFPPSPGPDPTRPRIPLPRIKTAYSSNINPEWASHCLLWAVRNNFFLHFSFPNTNFSPSMFVPVRERHLKPRSVVTFVTTFYSLLAASINFLISRRKPVTLAELCPFHFTPAPPTSSDFNTLGSFCCCGLFWMKTMTTLMHWAVLGNHQTQARCSTNLSLETRQCVNRYFIFSLSLKWFPYFWRYWKIFRSTEKVSLDGFASLPINLHKKDPK